MEFRNHQVKIGHMLAQFRGNPIGLVLLVLLVPVALAIVVFVGVVVFSGIIVMRIAQAAVTLLTGRPAPTAPERAPFPFGGVRHPSGDSAAPNSATPHSAESRAIDVEVVRKSEDQST